MVGDREQNIRRIIEMEDRICQCQRCPSLVKCLRKPSMGKGELDPEVLLVFEYENYFTRDINNIVKLHNLIKQEIKLDKVYHTYMVRCQPKACTIRQSVNCYGQGKWIDKDYSCLLTSRTCEGVPVRPGIGEIISCLPFLLEEIEILHPMYLVLFGERVAEFVLKSYGFYSGFVANQRYEYEKMIFLTSVNEDEFRLDNCHELASVMSK